MASFEFKQFSVTDVDPSDKIDFRIGKKNDKHQ